MVNRSEELDNAIAKLHQNFQELSYHLEKSFLEQGRALLKFEAQWKDLSKENEQRQVHLQQMVSNYCSLNINQVNFGFAYGAFSCWFECDLNFKLVHCHWGSSILTFILDF